MIDANPAHKRSLVLELTSKGSAAIGEVQAREKEPLRQLAASMSPDELRHVEVVLTELNRYIALEIASRESDEYTSN